MRTPVQRPPDDPADLKRLDDEFLAKYRAGTIPSLDDSTLEPATDPFGRNFSWLSAPANPYDAAFDALANRTRDEWYQRGGSELRLAALGGSYAAGSNEDVYRTWAHEQFAALCFAAGEEGDELLTHLKAEGELAPGVVYHVATFLERQPTFAELTPEQRVIAAMIAIESLRPPARR